MKPLISVLSQSPSLENLQTYENPLRSMQSKKKMATQWRRQSTPTLLSPRANSNPEKVLQKKLELEESLLVSETQRLLSLPKNNPERVLLQQKVNERTRLVEAMKSTLGLQQNILLSESYIRLRHSTSEDFKKYWCVIEFPSIKVYETDRAFSALEYLPINRLTEILLRTSHEFSFTIKYDRAKSTEFIADSEEECTQWVNALSHFTKVQPSSSKIAVRRRRKSIAPLSAPSEFQRTSSNGQFVTPFQYTPSVCEDFEIIKSCFSDKIQTSFSNGNFHLQGGTFDDIIKWCIVHSVTKINEDSAALFLCKHWFSDSEDFKNSVIRIWKEWEELGFPFGIPRNVLSERLANFATQFIECALVDVNSWDKEKSQELKQKEITARRKFKTEIEGIHYYFKKAIDTAKVPRRTISLSNRHSLTSTSSTKPIDLSIEDPISFSPKDIAGQLTIIQAGLLAKLSTGELMDKNWEDPIKSPGLKEIASVFNRTTSWVISSILGGKDTKEQTTRYIKFIKIAHQLHLLRNCNSCTAILGGLGSAAISRLQRFKNIPDKDQSKLDKLKDIYSPLNGYSNYRNLPKGTHCIPVIGVYLRDLTLTYDGNSKYLDDDRTVISFDRMKLVAQRVLEFHALDTTKYSQDITAMPTLQGMLRDLPLCSQDDLYEKSLLIEPKKCNKTPEMRIAELERENKLLEVGNNELRMQKKDLQDNQEDIQSQLFSLDTLVSKLLDRVDTANTSDIKEELNFLQEQLASVIEQCTPGIPTLIN